MIIADDHKIAFVHIPKCGGMSVRKQLLAIDTAHWATMGVVEHPRLGAIHPTHIPLRFLAREFPREFQKIAEYRSFALVREPYARFASAIFQRFEEFKGVGRLDVTFNMVLEEAREAIRWLSGRGPYCDADHIHYSRQVDYVELDGKRVVSDVYALENLADMALIVEQLCGIRLDAERRENANFASSNRILSVLHVAKPIYSRLTTWAFREQLVMAMRRMKLHGPEGIYEKIRRNPEISRFVEDYYAADIKLYNSVKHRVDRVVRDGLGDRISASR